MKARFIKVKQKKFEKLSDANKIRYHLGVIAETQFRIMFILGLMITTLLGCFLTMPLIIRYFSVNKIIAFATLGVLIHIGGIVFFLFVGNNKLNKIEKGLEDFLNGKQKK